MIETQLLMAAYGVLLAIFFPLAIRHFPAGIGLLWLVGLGLARFYCQNLIGDSPRKVLGVPVYAWAYVLLSAIPALSVWADFPPGALFMIVQPYLAYRLQLRATPIPEGE